MENLCPSCQSPIPPDAPGGLCPACVLRGVVAPTNPSQPGAMKAPVLEAVTSKPEGGTRNVGKWRTVAMGAASLLAIEVVLWLGHRLLPPVYFAKVLMEVKPDNSIEIGAIYSERAGRTNLDPMFVSTQIQVLQRTEILHPVIENLKLIDAWSTEARPMTMQSAHRKLLGMLEFREVRKPALIGIGVYSNDAQEAANIANTIAVVYQQKRLSDLQKNIDSRLEFLKNEVLEQRKLTDKDAVKMEKIRLRDGINDPNPLELGSIAREGDRRLLAIEAEIDLAMTNLGKLGRQVEHFMKLKPEQLKPEDLKQALRVLEIRDVKVDGMIEELQAAQVESAKLLDADLGENHPRLVPLGELKETLSKQLADQLNTIRSSQVTKVRDMQGVVADLGGRLELAKKDQIEGKRKSSNYQEAKMRFLHNKRILEAAQTRYSQDFLERGVDFDPCKDFGKS